MLNNWMIHKWYSLWQLAGVLVQTMYLDKLSRSLRWIWNQIWGKASENDTMQVVWILLSKALEDFIRIMLQGIHSSKTQYPDQSISMKIKLPIYIWIVCEWIKVSAMDGHWSSNFQINESELNYSLNLQSFC